MDPRRPDPSNMKIPNQVMVVLFDWLVVINIYRIQSGSCIGKYKHVGQYCFLYYFGKFRCGKCGDICTTKFDLCRDASNTGIISLYRYGIKCSCSYSSWAFFSASVVLKWSWNWLLIWEGTLFLLFTTKGVLWVNNAVMSIPPFIYLLYLPPYTPLILNGSTSSRSFKYENSKPSYGGALWLTGGNQYLPDSIWLLYWQIQTCWTILFPLLFWEV